ncbi:MAG: hypothetical protein ACXWC7_15505 [Chitinophagaceae bacterium]
MRICSYFPTDVRRFAGDVSDSPGVALMAGAVIRKMFPVQSAISTEGS